MRDEVRVLAFAAAFATAGSFVCGCGPQIAQLEGHVIVSRRQSESVVALFERLVAVAESHDYTVVVSQPDRGRFGILAKYQDGDSEEYTPYRFAVSCRGRRCLITPLGPRVEWYDNAWSMPKPLRDELEELSNRMGGRVVVLGDRWDR